MSTFNQYPTVPLSIYDRTELMGWKEKEKTHREKNTKALIEIVHGLWVVGLNMICFLLGFLFSKFSTVSMYYFYKQTQNQ